MAFDFFLGKSKLGIPGIFQVGRMLTALQTVTNLPLNVRQRHDLVKVITLQRYIYPSLIFLPSLPSFELTSVEAVLASVIRDHRAYHLHSIP